MFTVGGVVTVLTDPFGQACTVSLGSGTIASADVTDVDCVLLFAQYLYVTNILSDEITTFGINPITGAADRLTVEETFTQGPVAIDIDPAGCFAFVANLVDETVTSYTIDSKTGVLNEVGSEAAAESGAFSITVTGGTQ